MKLNLFLASLGTTLALLAGCAAEPLASRGGGPQAFRVRSAFAAALNSDQGWAGALNENVTIQADQPFRVRFEVEPRPGAAGEFRLQYRRNAGGWIDAEAHDFPHPVRELHLDFRDDSVGAPPGQWKIASGNPAQFAVAADGNNRILQAGAGQQPLVVLHAPPWPVTEFVAEFRLPAASRRGPAFVFGYVDAGNHGRVTLDLANGVVRVSRIANGVETVLAEQRAVIDLGQWQEIEIQTEDGDVEVNYADGRLELSTKYGAEIPPSPIGLLIPSGGAAEFRGFALAGEAQTPRVSIVACPGYDNGAATTDLLNGSAARFQPGAGLSLAERTGPWSGAGGHGEFEWAIVIRRYAGGAVANEEGDTFDLRMVDASGAPASAVPSLRFAIPAGHVGGTYVETPGRIGPWCSAQGDLYFIMEPAETNNVFMMMKSADNGRTWREVDPAHRPVTNDLESVDARQVGDTIHIIHQVTRSVRYHSFRTSDHPTQPDTWAVRDEVGARVDSIAQAATMVVRTDGSIVAFYVADTVHYATRSPAGPWSQDHTLDAGAAPKSAGPRAVLGANDTVHLAYYGMDGTIWYRRLLPNGTLTARQQLAAGLGAGRPEYGAVLPLVFIPATNTVVIIYRQADGHLWERRIVNDGGPTPAVRVTDRAVVQDAVDSQQPGADAAFDGENVRVLFIAQSSRSIFSTTDRGGWQPSQLQVGNIRGSWIRGDIHLRADGTKVYAYIYDAGSDGGAGMNRFNEWRLDGR